MMLRKVLMIASLAALADPAVHAIGFARAPSNVALGSPLIDADGRIVGLLFDGNIHSISGAYWFDTAQNRSVAVHPAIMREALTKVYRPRELLEELGLTD